MARIFINLQNETFLGRRFEDQCRRQSKSHIALPHFSPSTPLKIRSRWILRRSLRSFALWRCLFLAAYANGLQQRLVGLFLCTCPQRRGIGKYTDVEAPFAALSILLALTPLPALDWTLNCHTIDLTFFKLIFYLGADSRSLDKSPRQIKAMNKSGCMLDTPSANL